MEKRVYFRNLLIPYALLAPQLIVTGLFFLWPAFQALYQSFLIQDPFGTSIQFVWFDNFLYLFRQPQYYQSIFTTLVFSASVTGLSLAVSIVLAVMADRVIKGAVTYKTLLIWPYAVAPAIAGVLWLFLFSPAIGLFSYYLRKLGYQWNPVLNGNQALLLVIIAAAWKQISYNFLFFLAGLQAIPKSLIEAAAIDGAGPMRRFWTIILPLLSPTTFFLIVVNLVYAFFDTFSIIHAVTKGGPGQSTTIMVYKVYADGFVGLDLGSSSAQSVILMILVGLLTVLQFRYIERKVHY